MILTPPLNGEPLISLSQAANKFPGHRGANRLHTATLTRWILRGVKAPDGLTVRLQAVRGGHRWLTSDQALGRFLAALTPPVTTSDIGSSQPLILTSRVLQEDTEIRNGGGAGRGKRGSTGGAGGPY